MTVTVSDEVLSDIGFLVISGGSNTSAGPTGPEKRRGRTGSADDTFPISTMARMESMSSIASVPGTMPSSITLQCLVTAATWPRTALSPLLPWTSRLKFNSGTPITLTRNFTEPVPGRAFQSMPMEPAAKGLYQAKLEVPEEAYTACFVETEFLLEGVAIEIQHVCISNP